MLRITFDLWVCVSSHLSVHNLLSLRSTCKYLYRMMEESSIWALALLDILDVAPRFRIYRDLPSMTPIQLRRKSYEISRLYTLWTQRVAQPVSVTRHPLPVDTSRIDLLPGGALMLSLTTKGDLQLYQFLGEKFELLDTVVRNAARDLVASGAQLRRPKSPCPKNCMWAAIATPYRESSDVEPKHTEFRICALDIESTAPSLQVGETFVLNGVCNRIIAEGDLLIAITSFEGEQSCVIRHIQFPPVKDGGSRVIHMSNDMVNTRLAVVYPHILLLRSSSGTLLIYDLESSDDDDRLTLLASNLPDHPALTITDCLSRYGDAWVPTQYLQNIGARVTEGIRFVYSSASPDHKSEPDFDIPLDGPYAKGESHTVTRVINFGAGGPVGFQIFTSKIKRHNHPGYMRMGFNEAPSPQHTTYIPLKGRTGFVREVGFDEETGRIAAVFRPSNMSGTGPPEIIIANFV